jgi:hypothetical protein
MTSGRLENLVKIKKLKVEPPDQKEFDGMVSSARSRLKDAEIKGLSDDYVSSRARTCVTY